MSSVCEQTARRNDSPLYGLLNESAPAALHSTPACVYPRQGRSCGLRKRDYKDEREERKEAVASGVNA